MGNWVNCTEKNGGGPVHLNTSYIASAEWNEAEKATVITFKVGRNDTIKVKEPPDQILGDKYGCPMLETSNFRMCSRSLVKGR